MRALLLCALVATAAFADTAPPSPWPPATPRVLPKPGTAAWRRIDRAIAGHCRHTGEPACSCVLAALRAKPPELSADWDRELLVLDSDLLDVVIGATLAPSGDGDWRVVELRCTSLLAPRF